jgi:hypothetical protein
MLKKRFKKGLTLCLTLLLALTTLCVPSFAEGEGSISPQSLLQLEEITISETVDFTDYLPAALKSVPLSEVFERAGVDGLDGKSVVYTSSGDDDFKIAKSLADTIDLTPPYYYNNATFTTFVLEMIVGTANQLDPANKRYFITVQVNNAEDMYEFELYTQDETGGGCRG